MDTFTISRDVTRSINTNWTTTPIKWENVPFDGALTDAKPFYIIPKMIYNVTEKLEYGGNGAVNVTGFLSVRLIGRKNVGTGMQQKTANTFAALFAGKVIGNVHFREATIREGFEVENRWQINIEIPFNEHQTP